jgi:hypothetical protein
MRNEHDETQCSPAQFRAAVLIAEKLSNKDLVRRVKTGFQKIGPYIPDIQVLHDRFKALPRGKGNIDGCNTFKQFCERRLGRNYAHIARLLKAAREPEEIPEQTTTAIVKHEPEQPKQKKSKRRKGGIGTQEPPYIAKDENGNTIEVLPSENSRVPVDLRFDLLFTTRVVLDSAADKATELAKHRDDYPRNDDHLLQWELLDMAVERIAAALIELDCITAIVRRSTPTRAERAAAK